MDEFRDAIAKITVENLAGRGTGFLVASDVVATALHVVADRKTEPPSFFPARIHLKFRGGHETDAEVIDGKWNQDADCVLLRCLDAEPLTSYPTIPLRELNHSDDLLKMRGYPDAQPVDGMTWTGQVRDYAAQLTNFYATGSRPYTPVLQLFSDEAGAGSGPPPSGMSGAPVVVGTAAVGLVRFALMQQGSTVAGTLYACSARDIVALDPKRLGLRPPLAPVLTLSQEEITELTVLLVAAFSDDLEGLHRAIKFSLGVEAERSVPSNPDLPEFVSKLVPELMQQGPGMISVLVRAAITARPGDEKLRAFAEQVSPYSLQPLNDDVLVHKNHDEKLISEINLALIALTAVPPGQILRGIIAPYQSDFEKTREQILLLARYKELHNCLHAIQARLEEITNNVRRLRCGENVARYLRDNASFLEEILVTALNQLPGLPAASNEQGWIDRLAACAADIRATTMPSLPIRDREKVLSVPERLAEILPSSSYINEELVVAAKGVRLDNVAETLRSVEQHLGHTMTENSLKSIRQGSFAMSRLRSRLAGLVAEHDEWQSLNTDFEYTRGRLKHQPQARFPSWKQFRDKLLGLCNAFPQEKWSVELRKMMEPWMADEPPPEPQIPSSIAELDDDFLDFYQQCIRRFIKVDDELYTLCGKVTQFKDPLDALLRL